MNITTYTAVFESCVGGFHAQEAYDAAHEAYAYHRLIESAVAIQQYLGDEASYSLCTLLLHNVIFCLTR